MTALKGWWKAHAGRMFFFGYQGGQTPPAGDTQQLGERLASCF
jgi:hypothetical protein